MQPQPGTPIPDPPDARAPKSTSETARSWPWYDRRGAGVVAATLLGALAAVAFTAGIQTPWP